MQPTAQNTVTRLLSDLQDGKTGAVDKLFEQVYDILRDLAQKQRAARHGNPTLNTTALVHETYLKLVDQKKAELHSRAHFLNVAAKVMRHVLVDYARAKKSQKRGGEYEHVDVDESDSAISSVSSFSTESADQLIALDSALKKLQLISPREASIVECRFFAGMSVVETANIMDVSPMTVKRDWKLALAWLRREMISELYDPSGGTIP